MPNDLTRRQLLEVLGSAALLAGCGEPDPTVTPPTDAGPSGPPSFLHGVASGDPTPSAVILWTRVSPGVGNRPAMFDVRWVVAADEVFSTLVAEGRTTTSAERDWTVKVDATGLPTGRALYYRFECAGVVSPTGRTRTAPEGSVARLRFAVCSCSNYAAGYFHAYRAMAERDDLDAVLHLGDYLYEYPDGYYGNLRRYEPSHETITLADYRARYAQCRRDEDLQAVHARHPFVTVWDDHEFANNAWHDGAKEHMPATEGPWPARRQAATRAYFEWMPIREQRDGRIFRALAFGDLCHLVMLDTRVWGRDVQPATPAAAADPRRQILGADQERWLIEQVTGTRARWKVLGQQVIVGQFRGFGFDYLDVWEGYPAARERLFQAIRAMGVSDVVVLTGDIHSSFAMDLTSDPFDPARYDPATGRGAIAVEFVTPAVSSPPLGFVQAADPVLLRRAMPHLKYLEATRNGYTLVELTPARAAATWVYVSDVRARTAGPVSEGATYFTAAGDNHLTRG
jgi:alkaline phosphatase D